MIIEDAHHTPGPFHRMHRELNYKICNAMNPLGFSIVLDKMVKAGMDPKMLHIFEAQFQGLLAAVRTENNRLK